MTMVGRPVKDMMVTSHMNKSCFWPLNLLLMVNLVINFLASFKRHKIISLTRGIAICLCKIVVTFLCLHTSYRRFKESYMGTNLSRSTVRFKSPMHLGLTNLLDNFTFNFHVELTLTRLQRQHTLSPAFCSEVKTKPPSCC